MPTATARRLLHRFRRSEDGAVSVDFVILTTAVLGLALAASTLVWDGTTQTAARIADFVVTMDWN